MHPAVFLLHLIRSICHTWLTECALVRMLVLTSSLLPRRRGLDCPEAALQKEREAAEDAVRLVLRA